MPLAVKLFDSTVPANLLGGPNLSNPGRLNNIPTTGFPEAVHNGVDNRFEAPVQRGCGRAAQGIAAGSLSCWRRAGGNRGTAYRTGTDSAKPGPWRNPARCTETTSPFELTTGLPEEPPVVMPSNWIRSAVTRDRIPAVIEVRMTLARSRAKPEPAGNPISAAGSPWLARVPSQSTSESQGPWYPRILIRAMSRSREVATTSANRPRDSSAMVTQTVSGRSCAESATTCQFVSM